MVYDYRDMASREPLVAIGVATMRAKLATVKVRILSTWGSLIPPAVVLRFVVVCREGTLAESDIVCSQHDEEHPKTIAWFRHALLTFPHTPWIAHSDDDTWVNPRVLARELRLIPPRQEAYGLIFLTLWAGGGKNVSFPIIESFADPVDVNARSRNKKPDGSTVGNRSFLYPFLQGGFYALTRDLVEILVPVARGFWKADAAWIRRQTLGEDAFLFGALHIAAARANLTYKLNHLSWSRYHDLPDKPERMVFGMGWVFPTEASTVVHYVKGPTGTVHHAINCNDKQTAAELNSDMICASGR